MSRYGDRTPKEVLWGGIKSVQEEYGLTWLQVLKLLAEICADILHYELDTEEA